MRKSPEASNQERVSGIAIVPSGWNRYSKGWGGEGGERFREQLMQDLGCHLKEHMLYPESREEPWKNGKPSLIWCLERGLRVQGEDLLGDASLEQRTGSTQG